MTKAQQIASRLSAAQWAYLVRHRRWETAATAQDSQISRELRELSLIRWHEDPRISKTEVTLLGGYVRQHLPLSPSQAGGGR
jgi:hypothetical protein